MWKTEAASISLLQNDRCWCSCVFDSEQNDRLELERGDRSRLRAIQSENAPAVGDYGRQGIVSASAWRVIWRRVVGTLTEMSVGSATLDFSGNAIVNHVPA